MIRRMQRQASSSVEDRSDYDFHLIGRTSNFWAPIATGRDAARFGRWANPFTHNILCYDNGRVTRTDCETEAEFTAELEQIARYHAVNDEWKGIRPLDARVRRRFISTGAGALLHPACAPGEDEAAVETSTLPAAE